MRPRVLGLAVVAGFVVLLAIAIAVAPQLVALLGATGGAIGLVILAGAWAVHRHTIAVNLRNDRAAMLGQHLAPLDDGGHGHGRYRCKDAA